MLFPRTRVAGQECHVTLIKGQTQVPQRVDVTKTAADPIKFDQLVRTSALIKQRINKVTGSEIAQVFRLLPDTNEPNGAF